MHAYANPARFASLARPLIPAAAVGFVLSLAAGLVWGLWFSPADYQQGETVRIMYVHVPAAWMALACYASMATAAVVGLIWRHPLAELYPKAVAPVGAAFTALCLVTGMIWGAPMWGTWWVWDARLTSVLLLFFLYLGYIALVGAFDDEERGLNSGAILLIIGSINLPIIRFSVDWWNTLHQPASVLRLDGPAIHTSMLYPLLVMAFCFLCLFIWASLLRLQTELMARKIAVLHTRTLVMSRTVQAPGPEAANP